MASKNRQISYGIKFDVDKASLNDLMNSLKAITKYVENASSYEKVSTGIEEAADSAKKLQTILNSSWNNKLNQFDLANIKSQIDRTFGSVEKLKINLENAGTIGSTAFNQFASSVLTTNLQLGKTSTLLDKMAITMANTVRFGISSRVFNNLTGSIEKAYGYIKNLDQSLNDIRIVTGQSAKQMESFAINANKAAQQMGATTLDYTKASLIYYQQGLNPEEVAERTEITLKMANVLGTSAQDVSSYMTAIWNNFDDGSKSLEHYADVITALGAATASSSEEIATGLEKFAAIANTVGLSYEYATTALATVVAQTRQSADTVGTAFKTIFARMEDLKLGETLDDGTTLGKYSSSLEKIGVNIKDQNGQLKSMDVILEEMGEKWSTIDDATKIAVAQSVAGIRQYSQLLALLDNWDKFQENLDVAQNATGNLQKQQEIYLDSVEAHLNKLTAETEKFYKTLLNEKMIKSFTDLLTGALKIINSYLTGLGGGFNNLLTLGGHAATLFSKQIAQTMERRAENKDIKNANEQGQLLKEQIIAEMGKEGSIPTEQGLNIISDQFKRIKEEQIELNDEQYNNLMNIDKEIVKNKTRLEQYEKSKKIFEEMQSGKEFSSIEEIDTEIEAQKKEQAQIIANKNISIKEDLEELNYIKNSKSDSEDYLEYIDELSKRLKKLEKNAEDWPEELTEKYEKLGNKINKLKDYYVEANKAAEEGIDFNKKSPNRINEKDINMLNSLESVDIIKEYDSSIKAAEDYKEAFIADQNGIQDSLKATNDILEKEGNNILNNGKREKEFGDAVRGTSVAFTTLTSTVGIFETAFSKNLNDWEKFKSITSVVAIQGLSLFKNYKDIATVLPSIIKYMGMAESLEAAHNLIKTQGLATTLKELAVRIAIKAISSPIGWIAIGAAIAVATVSLGKWIAKTIEANKEENKIKKRIKETEEAVKKAKEAYEELKTTVENYKDARNGIDELTEGTLDYYEAIVKSNEAAQELIDKLHLVAGIDYTLGKDGLIQIQQTSLDNAMFNELQNTYAASAANMKAQLDLIDYEEKELTKKFREDVIDKIYDSLSPEQRLTTSRLEISNRFTEEDARNILEDNTNKLILNENDNNNSVETAIDKASIDITESIKDYLPQYKALTASRESKNLLYNSYLLRSYMTQDQTDEFNQLSQRTQEYILKEYEKQRTATIEEQNLKEQEQNYKTASGLEKFFNGLANNTAYKIVTAVINPSSLIFGSGAEQTSKNLKSYTDAQKKAVASYQLIQQGYELSSTGNLVNYKTGQIITKDDLKEIIDDSNFAEKMSNYFEGGTTGTDFIDHELAVIDEIRKNTQLTGQFNKQSVNYITEAIYGFKTGNLTEKELSLLTPEERQYIRQQISETSSQDMVDKNLQYYDNLIAKIDEADGALRRQLENSKYYYEELQAQAEALGTTAEALDFYAIAMDNANNVLHEQNLDTAEAAIAEYKFNKEYNDAIKIWDDNVDAIKAYKKALDGSEEISYDLADAMGELSKSLKKIGLSLKGETIINHLEEIEKLLTGTKEEAEEVYKNLYKLSQLDTLKSFFGDPDLLNDNSLLEKYNHIIEGINNTQIGHNLSEQYAKELAQMIEDTELTQDQIKQLSEQLGIEIPIKFDSNLSVKDVQFTQKAQAIKHRYDGEMPDPRDPSKNVPVKYEWTEFIEDKTEHFLVPEDTNFTVTKNTQNLTTNFTKNLSNSSSGSSSKPKTIDPIDDMADRYHKVNTQITKVENSIKKLQSQQEKLVGKNLIDNLIAQWEELNQQITNYNDKLEIANKEQDELKQKLVGQGVQFNADGTISNYFQVYQAQEDSVNNLIAQYNMLSEAEKEAWDDAKTIDNAKEQFNQFKEDLDRYDELVSDFIPQLEQNIQDAIDKQIENQIQRFNMEITITLDMNQATRDWNAWAKRAMDGIDPEYILGNAQARLKDFYSYFNEKGSGDLQSQTKHAEDLLTELQKLDETGKSDVYGDNQAKALEDLKTYYQQLMTSITEVIELQDELHQSILDEMDEVQEKFDKQINSYSLLRDMINHDIKILQLTLGENSYGEMAKFYEMQQENYEKQLDFQRQQKDFWYAEMQAAEEGSKEWESAREKWENAVKDFNSILEEGLENAKKKFENTINDIFDKLNKSLTGGLGLDFVNTQWDLINKNADKYLDTINATYGIRELEKKYIDSINKTDSITVQQKLQKVMNEQLSDLKEKDRITQYDLDRANKLYEIELARINLQEAQRNKSQMRLRRDSQGNYTYQYVANNDAVSEAENELSNLYNSLYNFDKERYNSTLNDLYSAWDNYQKAMAEAAMINDPELRAEKEKLIQEQYNELMVQIEEDYQVSKYNLEESFFQDWVNLNNMELQQFSNLTEEEKDLILTELVPTWKNGLSEMAEAFSGENGFANRTRESWIEIEQAQQEYMNDTQTLEYISGQTFESIINGQDEILEQNKQLIKDNEDLITSYGDELRAVQEVYKQLQQNISLYESEYQAAKNATAQMYKYQQSILEAQRAAAAAQQAANTQTIHTANDYINNTNNNNGNNYSGGYGGGSSYGGTSSSSSNKITINLDDGYESCVPKTLNIGESLTLPTLSRPSYTFNGWNIPSKNTTMNGGIVVYPTISETYTAQWTPLFSNIVNSITKFFDTPSVTSTNYNNSSSASDFFSYKKISFDTGGYTGEWDQSGRLAVLHQKELVLNAQDTANMLNTVAIIRNINDSLGSNTLARLASISANNVNSTTNDSSLLEQNVHIDASFPNVHNAAEIEQALNNLVNAASQRVMIRK